MRGDQIQIHYAEDWAALYVNGKLETVGESYNAEEKAFALLGVTTTQDDAFMRGGNGRNDVAQTLEDVEDYRRARDARKAEAAKRRAEADALIAQAAELDPEGHARLLRQIERAVKRR